MPKRLGTAALGNFTNSKQQLLAGDMYKLMKQLINIKFYKNSSRHSWLVCNTNAPWLMMESCPNKPTVNWKYKLKTHLVHLTYWTSQLSLADIKCAQNTIAKNTGNVVCYRISVVYPSDHLADWKLWLTPAAQHHERVLYHLSLAWERSMCISFTPP